MITLIAGLILTYTFAPDYYVQRYREVQQGHLIGKEKLGTAVRAGFAKAIRTRC